MDQVILASYFAAAVLFILGLRRMSSPVTARNGIVWAGVGMLVAVVATFFTPGMHNRVPMVIAIVVGVALAGWWGRRVPMTGMPQMIALFNGMGGGAAGAIAAVELLKGGAAPAAQRPADVAILAVARRHHRRRLLQRQPHRLLQAAGDPQAGRQVPRTERAQPGRSWPPPWPSASLIVLGETGVSGHAGTPLIALFFALALAFGVLMTLPIGGADMPVVISLYNALTGLAVAFEGYVLGNAAMIIAGMVVGAAGTLLTQLMARAMNRSLAHVLFSGFGAAEGAEAVGGAEGNMKPIEPDDAAIMMAYADKVVIAPGYGMAVAQAQHKIWELAELLRERGVQVKFAIHPVAGRMPGHMNVLLAEAGVPYDLIYDIDEINPEFATTDVALVIGANDTVNPGARTDTTSPIYGMPVLDVDQAKNVIVIKRGRGAGFAGVENPLFFGDNTRMLYGDGQDMAAKLIQGVKQL